MKEKSAVVLAFLSVTALLVVGGCQSARRGAPFTAVSLETPELVAGQKVFQTHCSHCHPGGDGGLGPAINNKPLPDFLIRFQIRNGLGVMPAFSEEQISEAEMENLLNYLAVLKKQKPPPD